MTSDCSMKLEEFEELSSRRRRGACGLDGEALEPSGVTGLRRRWPGATLREDIGDARLLSSLIVREAVPAVEESAPGFATSRSFSFLFLKKKRVLARLQRATLQPPAIPNFAHTAFLGAPPTPQDPDNCAPSHETETSRLRVRGARILQKGQFRRFSSKLCNVGTQDCHVGF